MILIAFILGISAGYAIKAKQQAIINKLKGIFK